MKRTLVLLAVALIGFAGCNNPSGKGGSAGSGGSGSSKASEKPPVFSLAWSEYPSWSVFGVSDKVGLIDAKEGALGEIEKKWNVDIVLNRAEYGPCLDQYNASVCDAVCITNMDILGPCLKRASVAVLPTSTSVGGDACIVVGDIDLAKLKSVTTRGLEKSVSQFAFERVLEKRGENPKDYKFQDLDPGVASQGMIASQADLQSIMVWNPFVIETLRQRKDAKRLFDSSDIPEEIIDMVVVSKDSLNKPGGKRFAYAVLETYYGVNQRIADPKTHDETLIAIGEDFSHLGLEDMKQVVVETKFYDSPEKALALFEGDTFRNKTMPMVVDFCVAHEMCESKPKVAFGDATAQLNFDLEFLNGLKDGIKPDQVK